MTPFQVLTLTCRDKEPTFQWQVPREKPSKVSMYEFKRGDLMGLISSVEPLMTDSTVHHAPSGETQVNQATRKSRSFARVELSGYDFGYYLREKLEEACTKIHPRFNGKAYDQLFEGYSTWQLLRYEPGDFFDTHTDGQMSCDHWCTALLFPPAKHSPFEGGELDFMEYGKIAPATFTEWTLVLMPIALPHKCCTITSGVRYVFKAPLLLPAWIWNLDVLVEQANVPLPVESDLSGELQQIRTKIAKAESELVALHESTRRVEAHEPSSESLATLKQVQEAKQDRVVVMLRTEAGGARAGHVTHLTGEDRRLFNLLVQHFPRTSVLPGPVMEARGEELYDQEAACTTTMTLAGMWEDSEEADTLLDACVLFQDGQGGATSLCAVNAEYNDSSYDRKIYFSTLMVIVQKA